VSTGPKKLHEHRTQSITLRYLRIFFLLLLVWLPATWQQPAMAQDDTLIAQDATLWIADYSNTQGWSAQPYYWQTIRFPDVNGDGRADVCGRGEAGIWCALSSGSAFAQATLQSSTYSNAGSWHTQAYYWQTIQFPDVNGDGKADVCGRGQAGIYCELFGAGAPPPPPLPPLSPATVSSTCPGNTPLATMSWLEAGRGSQGYYVDVDNNNNWDDGFWNKSISTGTLSATAPEGFNAYGGASGMLILSSGSPYQVRVYYVATGEHSPTASFTAASCAISPPPPGSPPPPPPPPPGGTTLQSFDTNNNNLIDDPEFFAIIDAWIAGQLSDTLFFQAVDLWVSQSPITSAGSGSEGYRLDRVALMSSATSHHVIFAADGRGIGSLRVEVFRLSGERIFAQEVAGSRLVWPLFTPHGWPVSNGVYVYTAIVRGHDGDLLGSEVKKFVVLR
jgi:hypothetical protein